MPLFNQHAFLEANAEDIDIEAEKDYPVFRFNDLKDNAQDKFAKWIKDDSSVKTIRNYAKVGHIKIVLNDLNPILIRPGWRGTFSYATIYRWMEQTLSSMIFNSLYRRRPRNTNSWKYRFVLATPERAIENFRNKFRCTECNQEFSILARSPNDLLCQTCYDAETGSANDPDWPKHLCQPQSKKNNHRQTARNAELK